MIFNAFKRQELITGNCTFLVYEKDISLSVLRKTLVQLFYPILDANIWKL